MGEGSEMHGRYIERLRERVGGDRRREMINIELERGIENVVDRGRQRW